jgi:hypothetical protein
LSLVGAAGRILRSSWSVLAGAASLEGFSAFEIFAQGVGKALAPSLSLALAPRA